MEDSPVTLVLPEFSKRFEEDDLVLRSISVQEGALGQNDSDYHNMWGLFLRLIRRAEAIDEDPRAFLDRHGGYDTQALSVWTKLIDNARRILEGLNKMRNSDRLTISILESHTRSFAQALAGPLGTELREILEDLEGIPEAKRPRARLALLVSEGVVTLFRQAAVDTMARSRREYRLH